ncbi:unnamed protein product [Haemonchus placei]|uniref:Thioredoxin reductase 1, cytoplasmic n=1 Tax=Haemonchus placei TaxID=6290 RepID=A0A158QL10_HAEPC|nr:unnamed protein product [Haemonchus placei]
MAWVLAENGLRLNVKNTKFFSSEEGTGSIVDGRGEAIGKVHSGAVFQEAELVSERPMKDVFCEIYDKSGRRGLSLLKKEGDEREEAIALMTQGAAYCYCASSPICHTRSETFKDYISKVGPNEQEILQHFLEVGELLFCTFKYGAKPNLVLPLLESVQDAEQEYKDFLYVVFFLNKISETDVVCILPMLRQFKGYIVIHTVYYEKDNNYYHNRKYK